MARAYCDHTATLDRPLLSVSGAKAESGDNTLIAAPGAYDRIVLVSVCIQNESSTATTMILKDGSAAFRRVLGQNQGDGVSLTYTPGREKRLAANAALVLNLSGANSCGYSVDYFIERSNVS
ncbi:MAG: hypothetical protein WC718_14845 [Phycisphaerales bacterium]|jgi:hypothetical protein